MNLSIIKTIGLTILSKLITKKAVFGLVRIVITDNTKNQIDDKGLDFIESIVVGESDEAIEQKRNEFYNSIIDYFKKK